MDGKPGDSASDHLDGVREKQQIIARAVSNAAGTRFRAEVHGYQLVVVAKDGTVNEQPSAIAFGGPGAGTVNSAWQINTRHYTLGIAGTSGFSTGRSGRR